ncbi:MAG TPA: hypothetical protein VF628_08440 [Allosphingosinicella sp.]|jgi:hypothetical protein
MASASFPQASGTRIGSMLLAAVADAGSASHPYRTSPELLNGPDSARNLSDVVHFLCILYGRQPCAVDHAADRCLQPEERAWFKVALERFNTERSVLARLVVAGGPMPSTAGAVDSENAVIGQRHAIEMLAQSERRGCALGAALAIVLDWAQIRTVLDAASARFGIAPPRYLLGDGPTVRALAEEVATAPSIERAILFGATQVATQHHGLWDLLEARQQARAALG